MKNELTIIIGVVKMWGSIEWILPICRYMKENVENINIVFLILRKSKSEIIKENKQLNDLIIDISSNQYYDFFDILPLWAKLVDRFIKYILNVFIYKPQSIPHNIHNRPNRYWFLIVKKIFWKHSIRRWIERIKPDLCLSDFIFDDALFHELRKQGIKIGYYPDATGFIFSPDIHFDYQYLKQEYRSSSFMEYDFYLSDTKWRKDFINDINSEKKIMVVGPPRFDEYWIDYTRKKYIYKNITKINNEEKCNILVLLKSSHEINSKFHNFEELLREIILVCLSDKTKHITIKPHPSEDKTILDKIVNQFPKNRITVSHDSSIMLIEMNDIIISMPTGVILTSLILERPVIEYFNYQKVNTILRNRYNKIPKNILGVQASLDSNGDITSIYRKLGLVHSADNPQELELLMKQMKSELNSETIFKVRKFFPDGACHKATDAILSMVEIR